MPKHLDFCNIRCAKAAEAEEKVLENPTGSRF